MVEGFDFCIGVCVFHGADVLGNQFGGDRGGRDNAVNHAGGFGKPNQGTAVDLGNDLTGISRLFGGGQAHQDICLIQTGQCDKRVGLFDAFFAQKITIGAIAEAVNLAGKAGVSPETLFDAIKDGAAGSAMLNTRAEKIAKKDYAPGAKISINQKDMGNVLTFAEGKGIDLPLAKAYYSTLCRLSEAGLEGLDVSAVPEYYLKKIGE